MVKKNKPKTSVNVEAVRKEAFKLAQQKYVMGQVGNIRNSHAELPPGSVKRESPLEQSMGPVNYKQMIHTHNDKSKHVLDRLPFTFPRKKVVRSNCSTIIVECVECGYQSYGSEHTYMKTCPECKKATKVINPEAEARGEDRDFTPGFLASASDILRMKEEREKSQ